MIECWLLHNVCHRWSHRIWMQLLENVWVRLHYQVLHRCLLFWDMLLLMVYWWYWLRRGQLLIFTDGRESCPWNRSFLTCFLWLSWFYYMLLAWLLCWCSNWLYCWSWIITLRIVTLSAFWCNSRLFFLFLAICWFKWFFTFLMWVKRVCFLLFFIKPCTRLFLNCIISILCKIHVTLLKSILHIPICKRIS